MTFKQLALCAAVAVISMAATLARAAETPTGNAPSTRPDPITLSGDYHYYSALKRNGQPVCSERWRFGDDGSAIDFSGQEVVTMHFHIENGDTLVEDEMRSNGSPDCTGRVTKTYPTEMRIFLYRGATGDIVTCWPGQVPRIFGYIIPASAVTSVPTIVTKRVPAGPLQPPHETH